MKDLSDNFSYAVRLAQEKGASSWLSSLPICEHGHALHKSAFCDALALCYGWTPIGITTECVCGKNFTVEHALSYVPEGVSPLCIIIILETSQLHYYLKSARVLFWSQNYSLSVEKF